MLLQKVVLTWEFIELGNRVLISLLLGRLSAAARADARFLSLAAGKVCFHRRHRCSSQLLRDIGQLALVALLHMDPKEAENGGVLSRAEGILEPLPTLNLDKSEGKLDAGLRSLDHCEQLLPHTPMARI